MSAEHTTADAVTVHLTGSAISGAVQNSHATSLGSFPSETRCQTLTAHRMAALTGVRLDYVAALNGPGLGTLEATTADTLTWTPPDGTAGTEVTIANGETHVLGGGTDSDKYVIVTRTTAADVAGTETIQILDVVNNVIGGTNFTGDECAAGEEKYRALMFRNSGTTTITDLRVWLDSTQNTDVRLALEAPTAGALTDKTGAGEESQPAGLSWSTPVAEGTPLTLSASLAADAEIGMWIEQNVSASTTADPDVLTAVNYRYTLSGQDYYGSHRGVNRRAENGLYTYGVWLGTDADPDTQTAPDYETNSLPYAGLTGLANGHDYHVVVMEQNEYGLYSPMGAAPTIIRVDDSGDEEGTPPVGPTVVAVTPGPDGKAYVAAHYAPSMEGITEGAVSTNRADSWLIYLRDDGTSPDPAVDTPTVEAMANLGGPAVLSWTSTEDYLEDTPIEVLVRTRRVDDGPVNVDSENTDTETTTIERYGADRPVGAASLSRRLGVQQAPHDAPADVITYVDEPNNIRFVQGRGYTQFWADTVLIWNAKYWNGYRGPSGIFTTFKIKREAVSGAGTDDAIEVDTWNGSKILYVTVNGTRRMKIDVTNQVISFPRLSTAAPSATKASDPAWRKYAHTCLQVWDPVTEDYQTAASLDSTGIFNLAVAWRPRQTQGDCL